MMKWKKRMSAVFAAALMAASLTVACVPVLAEGGDTGGGSTTSGVYTAISGTTTTFTKHLVMDSEANIPNATFGYTVSAGTAMDLADNNAGFEILAGVTPEEVVLKLGNTELGRDTTNTSEFLLNYTTTDSAVDNVSGTVVCSSSSSALEGHTETELTAGKKCVWKNITLDFSQCSFTQPGVYRYILKEEATTNQGITNDSTATRYIDVYVIDNNGSLAVDSYVMHTTVNPTPSTVAGGASSLGDKSSGFVNTYDTSNLTFRKEVSGNQASKDKYFKFTVTISGAVAGTKYTVDILSASATTDAGDSTASTNRNMENKKTISIPDGATTVTEYFYLKHDQEITIKGIAKDSTYSVSEEKEDYTPEAAAITDYTDPISGTIESVDVQTSYKNTRSGTIPTGIILTIAPFAAAVLIGGAGLVMILVKKRKAREN